MYFMLILYELCVNTIFMIYLNKFIYFETFEKNSKKTFDEGGSIW